MKETIDVLELLQDQHREVDELIEKIENGNGDRADLFDELADKLAAHATVEEKIFYPAAMAKATEELLHQSVEEHLAIKRVLADMLELDPDDDDDDYEFQAKLALLKEKVTHHAHEEEEKLLFPMLRQVMTEDELAAVGNEVLAMFEELLPQHPCKNVANEIDKAAELPSP